MKCTGSGNHVAKMRDTSGQQHFCRNFKSRQCCPTSLGRLRVAFHDFGWNLPELMILQSLALQSSKSIYILWPCCTSTTLKFPKTRYTDVYGIYILKASFGNSCSTFLLDPFSASAKLHSQVPSCRWWQASCSSGCIHPTVIEGLLHHHAPWPQIRGWASSVLQNP